MSPQGQGPLVLSALWELSPQSEMPPAHPVMYLVMVVMGLPQLAKIVL